MSDMAWAVVVSSLLIVAAGCVALRTWQARRSSVLWMRPPDTGIAHAFTRDELESELVEITPLARCGQWPRKALVGDAEADRCVACVRAVEQHEQRRHR